ncbi:MAG: hypothetical protein HYX68_10955 [Planctomycetes bacterium]|nr:hypothetical protein [Planctomycetota bacterium]
MKRRILGALLLAGFLSGCVNVDHGPETGGARANYGQSAGPPMVPGVKGPHGEGVPMAAPYNMAPPGSEYAARMMMSQNQPLNRIQMHPPGMGMGGPPGSSLPMRMPGNGLISPPGLPPYPGAAPAGPFQKTALAGMMPGGGLMNANVPPGGMNMPGGVQLAQFANNGAPGALFPAQRTQVFFSKPAGMKIYWFTKSADGKPNYSTTPLETPGRYNFAQSAIYRLKLTHIPGRPALELYPTLEVVPTSPKTNEFLAHNSVPVEFSEDDFKQVVDRNYIVKVIYLPDPQFQDAAGAGPDEIVSTRLEPGQDPIQEALRRGSILLVLRIGNIDQGLQHSPGMTSAVPGGAPASQKPPGHFVPPLMQIPFPLQFKPTGPGAIPKQLPKMPEASNGKTPEPKKEIVPAPKDDGGNKIGLPALNLPAPPGFKGEDNTKPAPIIPVVPLPTNVDKPFIPPIPNPIEKKDKGLSDLPPVPLIPNPGTKDTKGSGIELPAPKTPILPASRTNEAREPITLPPIPPTNLLPGSRPDLPMIPVIPAKQ